jgi:macrodomain Ter protein organizer (MatP/YcbG family)
MNDTLRYQMKTIYLKPHRWQAVETEATKRGISFSEAIGLMIDEHINRGKKLVTTRAADPQPCQEQGA